MMGGLLLVDKPKGLTSHDVVLEARRRLPQGVRVGHCGTLDPLASGLLILLIGRATKLAAYYQRLSKVYGGLIRLGIETDTGDLDGDVIRRTPVPDLDSQSLEQALRRFVGSLSIQPPIYSAVKYKGKPLYAYARKGIEVPRKCRPCHVYDWTLLKFEPPEFGFRLWCSHGTYARALAVELGRTLGCAAVLSELRREKIGVHDVRQALSLEALRRMPVSELSSYFKPADPPPVEAVPV